MTYRASILSPSVPTALRQSTRTRVRSCDRAGWGIRRIRRSWYLPPPLPSLKEAERRMRSHPGFIASLTPEQRAMIDAYDGPEVWGNLNGPKRTF